MKKLIIIVIALIVSSTAFAQNGHYRKSPEKAFTFQVAPSVFSYNDNMLYGFHIGVNYKEALNVSYFSMRDYDFSEGIKDCGWYGLSAAYMLNITEFVGIGPVVRLANINGAWEKPYYGVEMRYDLSPSLKVGVEYGSAKTETVAHKGYGVKLIWNIF